MGVIDDFLSNGLSSWFGEALGLLHAIGSIFGMFLVFFGVLIFFTKITGFFKVKSYGFVPLIIGFILVSIFGWSFGLEYFNVVPM
jgi:hypothetical protein